MSLEIPALGIDRLAIIGPRGAPRRVLERFLTVSADRAAAHRDA
jgi:hypothetical protein